MRRLATLVAVGLCVWGVAALRAQDAPSRTALLIGNQGYTDKVGPLKNPHHDVALIEAALKRLGFKVTVVKDANYREMDGAVRRYVDEVRRAGPGAISFFYYSGHGAANPDNQINYLIPVDATSADTSDLWYQSFEQSGVIDKLSKQAPAATHFVVFDACRNELNVTGALKKGLGEEKGFVPVNDVRGMLIAYATGEKKSASDNGMFAQILAEELPKKGVEAVEMFRRVQLRVQNELRQEPWMSLRYLPPVYLGGASAAEGPAVDPDAEAKREWEAVDKTSIAELATFRKHYGSSRYAKYAGARLDELKMAQLAATPPAKPPVENTAKPAVGVWEKTAGPKVGESFRDCANCPEMVVVPSGSFMMGSPPDEPERQDTEGPRHKVTIKQPFAVGKYAVTFAEWDACVADGGCGGYKPKDEGWGRGDRPVINVNWDDAKAYAAWLSKKTGKSYRLLSEAEREYVARAGTTTPFWWGSSITPDQANYNGNSTYAGGGEKGEYRRKTVPVKSFQPNPWGLYQVHGNVWEWVEDTWHENYNGAPSDGSAWKDDRSSSRVLRGGSWYYNPVLCRSADRFRVAADYRIVNSGFRLARTLTP